MQSHQSFDGVWVLARFPFISVNHGSNKISSQSSHLQHRVQIQYDIPKGSRSPLPTIIHQLFSFLVVVDGQREVIQSNLKLCFVSPPQTLNLQILLDLIQGSKKRDDKYSIETFADHCWEKEVLESSHRSPACASAATAHIYLEDDLSDLLSDCRPLLGSCGITFTVDEMNEYDDLFEGFLPELFTRVYSSGHTMLLDSTDSEGIGLSFIQATNYERVKSILKALYPSQSDDPTRAEFGPFRLMAPSAPLDLHDTHNILPASSPFRDFLADYPVILYILVFLSALALVLLYAFMAVQFPWLHAALRDCLFFPFTVLGMSLGPGLLFHRLVRKLFDQGHHQRLQRLMHGRPSCLSNFSSNQAW